MLVSVVIPTYNRKKALFNAIQSVIDQTYKDDIEIIVVDDSPRSICGYLKRHFEKPVKQGLKRTIRYFHPANPRGSPVARNIGIKASKGDFIAFLDDDDIWYPQKLELQMSVMSQHPDCPLVICWSLDKRFGTERINRPPEIITNKMLRSSFNLSSTSTYLVRKYPLLIDGPFDEALPASQEYDLAICLSKYHDVRCIQKTLVVQHSTKGQISENWYRKIRGVIGIYHKHNTSLIKTVGVCLLFSFGYILGNRIYSIIIPIKEMHEIQDT